MRSSDRQRPRGAAGALLLFALLAPARAQATNPDAQAFFAQGRKHRQDGHCEQAIISFRHALETAPEGLGALRNIAECEEQLGRFASARNDWWSLRRAVLQSGDVKYDGWDKDAERAYRRLEPKVGKLILRLQGDKLDRVTVTIDGQPLDPRLIGVELERDLGPHTIEAKYGGVEPIIEKRTIAAGGRVEVTLAIPAATAPRAPVGDRAAPPAPRARPLRNAGFIALGAGGLAAIGALAAVGVRGSALSSIADACPGYADGAVCPASVRGDRDTGRTATTLVNVFSGIAVVAAATGAALVIVAARSPGAPAAAIGISPTAGGAGAWATVRF